MVSRYVTNGPVKQEGICLLPPPPHPHYRMMQPQRTDFHAGPQTYVQQQQPPNQQGSQGQVLRGMAPTGPSTQASTPPNTDLKVQHNVQPQAAMNLSFTTQRGQGWSNFPRPQPTNQTQRIVNPRQGQHQIYTAPASQYMIPPIQLQYVPYFGNGTQRPAYSTQNYAIVPGSQLTFQSFTPHNSTQPYFLNQPMQRQPPPSIQSLPTVPQSMATHQPAPNITMSHTSQQNMVPKPQKPKRSKAIPIIDPNTGKELVVSDDTSHPPSGESSARQTPQLAQHNPTKELQATFAKQVAQSLNDDLQDDQSQQEQSSQNVVDHQQQQHLESVPTHSTTYHSTTQAVHNTNRNDLVKTSKTQQSLKVPTAVEFVPANQSLTAKETPVVSALSNAVEVTILGKPPKDKESPAKGRKSREQNSQREHKESTSSTKDTAKEVVPTVVAQPPIQVTTQPQIERSSNDDKPSAPLLPTPSGPITKDVKEKENQQKEDKKTYKKENKEKDDNNKTNVGSSANQEIPAQDNAKSKHGSQRKDVSKQHQQQPPPQPQQTPQTQPAAAQGNQKQNTPIIAPQSQPTKPNNKSQKMKELNMKGASKEGSDMDAFNDNSDITNANVSNSNAVTVVDNANTLPPQPPVPTPTVTVDSNKKHESNEITTIKPDIKRRVDVTDIVKEVAKPFVAPIPVETNVDETDRAPLSNDKLVQAKNEVNSKTSVENVDIKLPYKENQWSPMNKDGPKVYDRDFLMALRNLPISKQRPDNLYNEVAATGDKSRSEMNRYANERNERNDFAPSYVKSHSQRGVATKRPSQQKIGNNSKSGKSSSTIKVSISFREDVKLHESENAWKPVRLNTTAQQTEEDKKTEELYRKVRGVLNKLTPQKFKTLLHQIKNLNIDTQERLKGVIDLVFEKAVDEPNFSVAYANMCKELALLQVPKNEGDNADSSVNFRKLIVTRCQHEFEKNSHEESNRNEKLKEIDRCTDPELKKELHFQLDEEDRRIRMKSVGNIRFIGELYKQNMLTQNIMMRCLHNLIEYRDEEHLECLCKLLTTIGKELDDKGINLASLFDTMKDISRNKNSKVSSRIRFMLQDVIDLRNCAWVPRRQDLNPRTMEQIQKEADNEHLNIQSMNSGPITPRKDDRLSSQNSDRKRVGRGNVNEEGWSTATTRKFSVQSDKLKTKIPHTSDPFGSSRHFDAWSRGSNFNAAPPPATNTANSFAALEIFNDGDSKSSNSRSNRDAYGSKGSMERNFNKSYSGRGSRSGSQHRSDDNSQRSALAPLQPTKPQLPPAPEPTVPDVEEIDEKALARRIDTIIKEYVDDCTKLEEAVDDIRNRIPRKYLETFLDTILNNVLDKFKALRFKTGKLIAELFKLQILSLDVFETCVEKIFVLADDLVIDIPNIWDCFAELVAHPVINETLSLNNLVKYANCLVRQGNAQYLIASLFKIIIAEQGPNFLSKIWKASNLKFEDFMQADLVEKFIANNKFEFLADGGELIQGNSNLNYTQIYDKLKTLIKTTNHFDDTTKWITANVGDRVKEKQFIRVLTTVVLESCIVHEKLSVEEFNKKQPLFTRYIDSDANFELECLYAVQALLHKLEHPQGLLLSIFDILYEENIIIQNSFLKWKSSDAPAEQDSKGVALKQLTTFFTQLQENDDSESSGVDEA